MLYAAGALEEGERDEYSRHLEEDDCAVCRGRSSRIRSRGAIPCNDVADANAFRVRKTAVDGSGGEQHRDVERVARPVERRSPAFAWVGWLAAAAALVLAAVFLNWNAGLRQEVQSLNARVVELESQITEQRTLLATLTSLLN